MITADERDVGQFFEEFILMVQRGAEITILQDGKPVAVLVPPRSEPAVQQFAQT